ncbi:MAG: hypothetical protein GY765_33170 [bacterium]|nr:hypothetical protein [bacterium]
MTKICILKNESQDDHNYWLDACKDCKEEIDTKVIDITRQDWLEQINAGNFDLFLARSPDKVTFFKTLYDERLYILHHVLGKQIYPSFEETLVYENKKFLSYWLKANEVSHPETWVFYHKEEAQEFAANCVLPIVGKTSIGAAGSGVRIIKDRGDLLSYIDQAFSETGIARRWGVNVRKGDFKKRLLNRLKDIPGLFKYLRKKRRSANIDPHRWFVIFQKFIPVDFEWRAVRVGESFFAHKKLGEQGGLISGTSRVGWDGPDDKLLDFVKMVTDKRGFLSQAVDIFVSPEGEFLVNELQCFFGSKSKYQMMLDGKPGRYVRKDAEWVFEEGLFNTNNSYDLRLKHAMELLASQPA